LKRRRKRIRRNGGKRDTQVLNGPVDIVFDRGGKKKKKREETILEEKGRYQGSKGGQRTTAHKASLEKTPHSSKEGIGDRSRPKKHEGDGGGEKPRTYPSP